MKSAPLLFALFLLVAGCGKSEDEIRSIAREELAAASTRTVVTDARVIGPYSPAVRVGDWLFVSGQIGMNPETLELAGNGIEAQTRQALENLMSVLRKAGYDSSHVVQCSVFLKDMNDFAKMNLIYGGYFPDGRYPARTTVEVSNLPRKAIVEIAAIAHKARF